MNTTSSSVQVVINTMIKKLSLSSEGQLCEIFGVSRGSISKWKSRGSVPAKYLEKVDDILRKRADAAEIIAGIHVSYDEVAEELGIRTDSVCHLKRRNPARYKLIEDGIRVQKISR